MIEYLENVKTTTVLFTFFTLCGSLFCRKERNVMRNKTRITLCIMLFLALFSPGLRRASAAPFSNSREYHAMESCRSTKDQIKRTRAIESYLKRVYPKISSANASLYAGLIERHSQHYKVDPFLVTSIMAKESTFKANAVSNGNYGLMQINWKANGSWIKKTFSVRDTKQLLTPENNIRIGACIIAAKIRAAGGDVDKGLDRYRGRSISSYRNGVMKHYLALYSLFARR